MPRLVTTILSASEQYQLKYRSKGIKEGQQLGTAELRATLNCLAPVGRRPDRAGLRCVVPNLSQSHLVKRYKLIILLMFHYQLRHKLY